MSSILRLSTLVLAVALIGLACNLNVSGTGGTTTQTTQARALLPNGIALNVDELPNDDTTAAKRVNTMLATSQPADLTIRAGGVIIHRFQQFADRALALGALIRSDVKDLSATRVEGTMGDHSYPYVADFSAFDIDGDGKPDGSGKLNQPPVAIRIWVNPGSGFEPFLCALVTTPPSDKNLGAGQVYVKPSVVNSDAYADLQIHVAWDRTDDNHKWNEAYLSGQVTDRVVLAAGHARVDVRALAGDKTGKTVRSTVFFAQNPWGFQSYSFAAHYERPGPYLLVSGQSNGGSFQVSFTNVCVDLLTRSLVADAACQSFDTQDMTLLSQPSSKDSEFPADFPAQPPAAPSATNTTTPQ